MPSVKHVDQSIDAIKRELEALDAKLNRGFAGAGGDAARGRGRSGPIGRGEPMGARGSNGGFRDGRPNLEGGFRAPRGFDHQDRDSRPQVRDRNRDREGFQPSRGGLMSSVQRGPTMRVDSLDRRESSSKGDRRSSSGYEGRGDDRHRRESETESRTRTREAVGNQNDDDRMRDEEEEEGEYDPSKIEADRQRQEKDRSRWTTGNSEDESDGTEDDDDMEAPQKEKTLTSAIVAPAPKRETASAARKASTKDLAGSRRMFGMLMGTLQQFQKSSQSEKEKQVLAKRESIAKKIEEKETQEQREAREAKSRLRQERMEKINLLRKLRDERAQALLRKQLRDHYLQLGNSIQLKASPSIFYRPAKHNEKTQALWEETKAALEAKYPAESEDEGDAGEDENDKSIENEVADIDMDKAEKNSSDNGNAERKKSDAKENEDDRDREFGDEMDTDRKEEAAPAFGMEDD